MTLSLPLPDDVPNDKDNNGISSGSRSGRKTPIARNSEEIREPFDIAHAPNKVTFVGKGRHIEDLSTKLGESNIEMSEYPRKLVVVDIHPCPEKEKNKPTVEVESHPPAKKTGGKKAAATAGSHSSAKARQESTQNRATPDKKRKPAVASSNMPLVTGIPHVEPHPPVTVRAVATTVLHPVKRKIVVTEGVGVRTRHASRTKRTTTLTKEPQPKRAQKMLDAVKGMNKKGEPQQTGNRNRTKLSDSGIDPLKHRSKSRDIWFSKDIRSKNVKKC